MTTLLLLWITLAAASPAAPIVFDTAAADSARAAIEKDRADTREWLKSSPTSYLATIQRRDFGERTTMTVGRDAGNDVRIDDPEVLPHHLQVTVEGDSFRVEAIDPGATFQVGDDERRLATVAPSFIDLGRFKLRLSHQRFPAIIVFDPKSPHYAEYKGIKYFPIDLSYAYVVPLTPNPEPDTVIILSTRGNQRRALRVGWFDLRVGKKRVRLECNRLLEPGIGDEDVSLFFRDATCGKESYPLGRYVNPVKLDDGRYVIDFNMAYNPACAYSDNYNCPIPPKANRIDVAIRAGEQNGHYHDSDDGGTE